MCDEDPLPAKRESCSRLINQRTVEKFSATFDSSLVLIPKDVDACAQAFNDHFTVLLDKVAPLNLEKFHLSIHHRG